MQDDNGLIKIGSSIEPLNRIKEIRYSNKTPIKTLLITKVRSYPKITEKYAHKLFKQFRVSGEWFMPHKLIFNYIKAIKKMSLCEDENSIYKDMVQKIFNKE